MIYEFAQDPARPDAQNHGDLRARSGGARAFGKPQHRVRGRYSAPRWKPFAHALSRFPGVRVVDDREENHFPMPIEASGRDEVLVGRLRYDLSNDDAIDLFLSGDQILKGAALNGIQIAEKWMRMQDVDLTDCF